MKAPVEWSTLFLLVVHQRDYRLKSMVPRVWLVSLPQLARQYQRGDSDVE